MRLLPAVVALALGFPIFLAAAEIYQASNGLELREFAREPMVQNTVAVTVDDQGRVYATSVVRRKAADLDIREFTEWIESDLSLTSIEEKRAFCSVNWSPQTNQNTAPGSGTRTGMASPTGGISRCFRIASRAWRIAMETGWRTTSPCSTAASTPR